VSARDEIFNRLTGALIPKDRANAMIDAYAHELAEKIRAEVTALGMASDGGARHYRDAANLIDPKVIT
jgi:hypothetical protein